MKHTLIYWLVHFLIGRVYDFAPFTRDLPLWGHLILYYITAIYAKRWVFRSCPKRCKVKSGAVCIVTGASAGIGAECARELVERGGKVIWAGRDTSKANKYLFDIPAKSFTGPRGYVLKLDLADMESIRTFVEEFRKRENRLDLLILNAGYHGKRRFTKDGFEQHFGVNHLGHMYLTYLLRDMLVESAPSRVIVVSSDLHRLSPAVRFDDLTFERDFAPFRAYNHSKLCNILFARQLSVLLKDKDVMVHSVHPGTPVQSELMRDSIWGHWLFNYVMLPPLWFTFCRQSVHGAQPLLYCALSDECGQATGLYVENCKRDKESKAAQDDESADKLWSVSCQMLNIPQNWF